MAKASKRVSQHKLRVSKIGTPGPMKHGKRKKITKAFTRKNTGKRA